MKDYIFILLAVGGYFVMFFGIELTENLMQKQILASIGTAMFGLSFPLHLMLDMYEEEKKKKKEED